MKTKLFYQKLFTAGALCALLCSTFGAFAQTTRELVQEDGDKRNASQKRVALVIGNAAYTKAKPLANPANDAADMAKALKDVGFEVISGTNQNKRQMETAIREFGSKLAASGGVGLFYYAGHGIQVAGENYLVPVDADIPEEDEVSYSAVPISLVLGKMATAKNDLNIVILDACRNNPFARSWTATRSNSNSDGLAKISPPTGTLVLYATEPGKVASDGTGRNGLFTEALLRQIRQPNLEYDQLVKAVSADVWAKSNRQQLPWKEGNTLQDFYFIQRSELQAKFPNPENKESVTLNYNPKNEVGDYRFAMGEDFVVSIKFENNQLVEIVPNQPKYLLQSVGNRRYKVLNGPEGFYITFRDNDAYIEQPQGNYVLLKLGSPAEKVWQYLSAGLKYHNNEKYDEALIEFTKAIDFNPNLSISYYYRGISHYNKGLHRAAIADFTKSLELEPHFPFSYNLRGSVYYSLKEWRLALADYSKAIEIYPIFRYPYLNRAQIYEMLGEKQLAEADRRKAEDLEKGK